MKSGMESGGISKLPLTLILEGVGRVKEMGIGCGAFPEIGIFKILALLRSP